MLVQRVDNDLFLIRNPQARSGKQARLSRPGGLSVQIMAVGGNSGCANSEKN